MPVCVRRLRGVIVLNGRIVTETNATCIAMPRFDSLILQRYLYNEGPG